MSISTAEPATSMYTPVSNSSVVAMWTSPINGNENDAAVLVKNVSPKSQGAIPDAPAASNPIAIQYGGWMLVRASTHKVPPIMYWTSTAVASTSPPTKPPPGALCPRSKKKSETSPATHSDNRTSTAGSIR